MVYKVFSRTWWRPNPAWPNGLEPRAGRKTTLGYVGTEAEARELCAEYSRNYKPGRLSRKAEYEEV
jgi:hypothetical protein